MHQLYHCALGTSESPCLNEEGREKWRKTPDTSLSCSQAREHTCIHTCTHTCKHTCTHTTYTRAWAKLFHRQSHSTAQGLCPCYYFVHTHPPHPNSSEDGVCWLKGGLGLGSGISWKPNKKFKAREEIIQRHVSNMGHAEDTG